MVLERMLWVSLFIGLLLLGRRLMTRSIPKGAPLADTGGTLLYFWGPRCAACAAAKPIITDLTRDVPQLCVRVIDATTEAAEARQWYVSTVPTLILLNDAGQITYRASGALSLQRLRAALGIHGPESSL